MERPTRFAVARVTLRIGKIRGAEPHTKGVGRRSKVRFLGLDVPADTIAVAVAEPDGELRRFGVIPNRLEPLRRMVKKLGPASPLRACYEAGNAHRRRVILEAAWAYRHRPGIGGSLRKRQQGLDPVITDMAWKAPCRLHPRYKKLAARGKSNPPIITAVGRELLGFVWAIAVQTECKHQSKAA